ncbi:cupredoxin domain-containing protein [Bacillus toyonensis]|uniref:cupredoxin domain-containing protein n=1 Tax=Bacillus toyonensis TaxID=155322 RepID=UPI000BF696D9|nr:cupredoxin domain-containing protein [Bacillus toyonensis]PGB07168.1 hypothetical protein COM09_31340 [Bacillus toyonensis]
MLYVISLGIVLVLTSYITIKTHRIKQQLSNMAAMMIAMTVAMMSSLLVGTIIGANMNGNLTTPVMIAVVVGMIIGYSVGHSFSLLASLDGVLSGIMGGMMGAMLGVMVISQNPYLVTLFMDIIFVIVMMLILQLIHQEAKKTENNTTSSPRKPVAKTILYAVSFLFVGLVVFFQPISQYIQNFTVATNTEVSVDTTLESKPVKAEQKQGYQESVVTVEQLGYKNENVKVKVGVPVKLRFQKDYKGGCLSELIIKDLNIQKNLDEGDNVVEFTPDKVGTIPFKCGMGMFTGNIIVQA